MIPASILTGFLGSGKTTILAHLMRDPALADTAVIINEFGKIGLDHDLIETSDETLVTLQTGCLCCRIQGDLVATLHDLLARRAAGTVPPFSRIVVETSGLADPAPILQGLMTDEGLTGQIALARVVTVVDCITGVATLEAHSEARKQVAVADRLVLSKVDLADGSRQTVRDRVAKLNPAAPLEEVSHGALAPGVLFPSGEFGTAALDVLTTLPAGHQHEHAHDEISCFAMVRDRPIAAAALSLFLEALADHCGADLLRLKGLVQIAEDPGRPAVIHGVQHVFHAPVWLDAWPSDDRRTRIVFIGRGIREAWITALLDAIEIEVGELTGSQPGEAEAERNTA